MSKAYGGKGNGTRVLATHSPKARAVEPSPAALDNLEEIENTDLKKFVKNENLGSKGGLLLHHLCGPRSRGCPTAGRRYAPLWGLPETGRRGPDEERPKAGTPSEEIKHLRTPR